MSHTGIQVFVILSYSYPIEHTKSILIHVLFLIEVPLGQFNSHFLLTELNTSFLLHLCVIISHWFVTGLYDVASEHWYTHVLLLLSNIYPFWHISVFNMHLLFFSIWFLLHIISIHVLFILSYFYPSLHYSKGFSHSLDLLLYINPFWQTITMHELNFVI